MKSPIIAKPSHSSRARRGERGVTIILVALTMLALVAMAALSIDIVTLYLANAEAQRSADAAALAGARILSLTGMTGDPNNSSGRWVPVCDFASKVAIAVAEQNTVGGAAPTGAGQVIVTFPNNSNINTCSGSDAAFGLNPLVQVKVQRTDLPTFFSRIWGRTGMSVSGTATAEAFNSSNSGNVTNGGPTGLVTPVQPRCVKPWVVPNLDPGNLGNPFVQTTDGSITSQGVRINTVGPGEVGETFNLVPDCVVGGASCSTVRPTPSWTAKAGVIPATLDYLPGEVLSTSTAVPSCASGTNYEQAVAGCDQTTVYQCGVNSSSAATPNRVDLLSENPTGGDSSNGVQCLINQPAGQDTLDVSTYPYRIQVGAGNPLIGSLAAGSVTTSSPSIVSLPIFDTKSVTSGGVTDVTIVGFLQVFINGDNGLGNIGVTVMNVTGCGNGTNAVGSAVSGTSPVPVRLITYP